MAEYNTGSRKARATEMNLGDIEGGYGQDDLSGLDYEMELETQKLLGEGPVRKARNKLGDKSQKQREQERQDAEYDQLRHGMSSTSTDWGVLDYQEEARKQKAKLDKQLAVEQEELQKELDRKKAEKERRKYMRSKKYLHSSERKQNLWEEKCEKRKTIEEAWEKEEEEHRARCDEFRQLKEKYDKQTAIDNSWKPKPKQAPKPKAKGKKGKGPPPDLAKMFGDKVVVAAQQQKEDNASSDKEKLPWDAEKGDKDPNRPAEEKREEKKQFEKSEKAHKSHLEEWSKKKLEHAAVEEELRKQGCYEYDLEEDPEFESSDYSSSESEYSDSDEDW